MNVAVVGSGTMGNGIAQVFATAGYDVTIVDKNVEALEKARVMIEKSLQKLSSKNEDVDVESTLSRLDFTTNISKIQNVHIVIEAIIEDIVMKKALFEQLDEICCEKTIFASNTSSLSISDLANVTNRPDRVCGLHFFNPVPLMNLVEVITTNQTSEETMAFVEKLISSTKKEYIRVADKPLFVVNRLLVPMICEAIFILEEGTATVEDIDKAMKLGASHPIGPLWLADMIGLDTMLNIQSGLYEKTGESKYKVPSLLEKMVRAGELGRKSGKGFYQYN